MTYLGTACVPCVTSQAAATSDSDVSGVNILAAHEADWQPKNSVSVQVCVFVLTAEMQLA